MSVSRNSAARPNAIAVQTIAVCRGVERSELKLNTTNSVQRNITPTSGAMQVKASMIAMLTIDCGATK